MRAMHIDEIGAGKVTFAFRLGERWLRHGTILSHDELARMPISNRNALIDKGYIYVWPKEAGEVLGADDGEATRFVVNRGFGHFDVVEGRKLNDGALTKEQALALAQEG